MPWNIAFDSKHHRIYVGDNVLYSVIDTNNNQMIKTIEILNSCTISLSYEYSLFCRR